SLVETGQTAEAQKVILDALERQVGGAGAAEAGGLTGAANRLSDAWGNLLEAIGQTSAVSGAAEGALDLLARGVEQITALFQDEPISVRIVAANRRLIEAQDELARLQAGGPGTPLLGQRFAIEEQRRTVEELQRQVDDLIAQARREADAADEERRRAEAGRRAAEADRLGEQLASQRKEIDEALDRLATDPAERIAKVNRELAETRRRLEALRAPDGSNAAAVDEALARAEALARRQIEAIERPVREAAARAAAANARVVEDLQRQLVGLADERQAFIDQALSRLSEDATPAQRAEVERLAGALYDEKQAREELTEAIREEDQLREEGRRLVEQLRTPTEAYAATVERLSGLLRAGAIDQETFDRALARANEDLAAAQARLLRQSRDWVDGVRRALKDYVDASTDAASAAEEATTRAFESMEDALASFVATGRLEFSSFADSILADITRIAVRQAILTPLAKRLESKEGEDLLSGLGQVLAGIFHRGGVVGRDATPARALDAAALLMAPRYHAGGLAGLAPEEMPAILRRGETVLTREQMAALGAELRGRGASDSRSDRPVTIVMNIATPDVGSFRYAQGQIAAEAARAIERARRNL
ncbi:MAG: hypothetical protein IRY94_15880, partial [Rhodospirillaceae bacterium]|nr:hypothetical protein [Rhodospirillaceae bacterium]